MKSAILNRMQNYQEYITIQPDILGGKPVIQGTRVPVALVVEEMAGGMTITEVMTEYELTEAQARAALQYAAAALREEVVFA